MSWVLLLVAVFLYVGLAPRLTARARYALALLAAITTLAVVYVMFP